MNLCVFPTCESARQSDRHIWCKFHGRQMTELGHVSRVQRDREGARSAWWWTQIHRAGGESAVAAACTEILERREMPADGIIRLFTVLQPWREAAA